MRRTLVAATAIGLLALAPAPLAQAAGICFDPSVPPGAPGVAVVVDLYAPMP